MTPCQRRVNCPVSCSSSSNSAFAFYSSSLSGDVVLCMKENHFEIFGALFEFRLLQLTGSRLLSSILISSAGKMRPTTKRNVCFCNTLLPHTHEVRGSMALRARKADQYVLLQWTLEKSHGTKQPGKQKQWKLEGISFASHLHGWHPTTTEKWSLWRKKKLRKRKQECG